MSVILDVDTGTDDAVAIMMATLAPSIDVLACTTVRGNRPVSETTANTLDVLGHIGRTDIPVYRGLDAPIVESSPAQPSSRVDRGGPPMHPQRFDLPSAGKRQLQTASAVEYLVQALRGSQNPVTIVATAPLTNIAAAVTMDPSIIRNVAELVVMGGAHDFGNVTPAAEANIWHDPFAADIVFRAGFDRIVLVPLDATHKALIDSNQADELAATRTPAGDLAAKLIRHRIAVHDVTQPQEIPMSAAVHDALCVAYLLEPDVLTLRNMHVGIELAGIRTYGRTVMDVRRRGNEPPNANVAMSADRELFFQLMKGTLGYNSR